MEDLITVRALQDLLHMDRTTIYRMLQERRLPGFKVGGQWRFSRREIDAWLTEQQAARSDLPSHAAGEPAAGTDVLPLHCLQPIQNVFAEAMDVGSVTTSPDGTPVTTFSALAPFCGLVLGTAEGRRRCTESWRALGGQSAPAPQLARCHAGLRYARGQVRVGGEPVAMVFAGQFRLSGEALEEGAVTRLASACGIDGLTLRAAAGSAHELSTAQANKVLKLLQVVADTFGSIGEERKSLLGRLRRISEMSAI